MTFKIRDQEVEGIVLFIRPLDNGFEIVSQRGARLNNTQIFLRFAQHNDV
jgi:hypothetical protein